MVALDTDLRVMQYSDSLVNIFHLQGLKIEGNYLRDLIKDIPGELVDILKKCILTGTPSNSDGTKFTRPDNNVIWFKWNANPLIDDSGLVTGLIVLIESVTAYMRQEEMSLRAQAQAKVGAWKFDLVSNNLYWTDVTKDIHEVPRDFEPDLENGLSFYKEGEDREKISQLVNDAMLSGNPYDTELQIITAKGRELWVRAKGEAEFINGKCVRLFGTFQDIDAQKRAEMVIREMADRLSIATRATKMGIWLWDIDKNSLDWDDRMLELYGYTRETFPGVLDAWESAVHPEDREKADNELLMAVNGDKEFDTEFRIRWPNGEVRYIRAMAETQRDEIGNAISMVGTNWDITELKTAQIGLIRSEESFMGAFEKSGIGMALVGLDGRWLKVNDSLRSSLGYTKSEFKKITFQDITLKEDLDKDFSLLNDVVKGKRDSYQIDKRYLHKDGSIVYVILTVTAVKDIHGNLSHFISQVIDITPIMATEKRLETLVQVTKDQNESLLNFAHIVSHNLRSHATNMGMLCQFLNQEKNQKEKQKIIKMLTQASTSLNETIQHLNDVVQVKTGALENMTSVNLLQSIKAVVKNINAVLNENRAVCKIHVSPSHMVSAIPAYLDSILLNLFTNAIKYKSGERKPVITIRSIRKNGRIILRFTDNGQGIDLKRHRDKIFGMYKTFHHHKEAKGIGLFITKNQVEVMNGRISVHSEVNVGTTFTVMFKQG